ncbi:hypothetical protein [Aureibaculum luteum]|nr:hypothetical protein [Aureibaculum luteum]
MDGFNIVMVIAIILFTRLGVRLFYIWRNYKNDASNKEDTPSAEE